MFGTLGGPELFLILVVALIIFGPRKLPEIGKSMGRMMAEFRKASNEFRQTIESEVEADKIREATRIEMPRLDISPAAPGVSPTAQAPDPDPEAGPSPDPGEPAAHSSDAPAPGPAEPTTSSPETTEPAEATVSREAPTPIEPR